jgi:transposase
VKKNNTTQTSSSEVAQANQKLTIGLDLGDRSSRYCILNEQGEAIQEGSVTTTKIGLERVFGVRTRCRIALEVGTHSPWVSRYLTRLGYEVIVANARRVRLITESTRKDDKLDAKTLARLARIDPELLSPIRHRGEQAQADLMTVRARAVLVQTRTALINAARGLTKSFGERLPSCGTQQMGRDMAESLSLSLRAALDPLLAEVETITERIQEYDRQLEKLSKERYPEVERLKQVHGVGTLIALSYVLTVEDPHRFRRSRSVGCYVGLRPKRRQSGQSRPELGISKEGDAYLRTLLVQGAHHILGPFGQDCDLRRWGLQLAAHGGKNAKKRAVVAVARKLAVLLHKLWVSGEKYEPLREANRKPPAVAA